MKTVMRWALTVVMVASGIGHFVFTDTYVAMMPEYLPAHRLLVYMSGVCEALGGLGLVLPATRRWAAWGLVALFLAVFPANLNMAIHHLPLAGKPVPAWQLWARLPLQVLFIAWAWWFTSTPTSMAPTRADAPS